MGGGGGAIAHAFGAVEQPLGENSVNSEINTIVTFVSQQRRTTCLGSRCHATEHVCPVLEQ